jgi:hypothetical protein
LPCNLLVDFGDDFSPFPLTVGNFLGKVTLESATAQLVNM